MNCVHNNFYCTFFFFLVPQNTSDQADGLQQIKKKEKKNHFTLFTLT